MSVRTNVSPTTLAVEVTDSGIYIDYLDGRRVTYRHVPERTSSPVSTPPGKEVHVLVTDASETEGVMTYVNDRKTHDEILESSGVGRIVLDPGESATLFPGVDVTIEGHSVLVDADISVVDGRVFVFVEDELGERSYELVDVQE